MARVAGILPFAAEATPPTNPLLRPDQKDLPYLLSFLERSDVFKAMGGLYGTGWRFHSLTPGQVETRLENGQVRTVGEHENIAAIAVVEPGYPGEGLTATYVDGRSHALDMLALGLRAEASGYNPPLVNVRVPDVAEVCEAFRRAGYGSEAGQSFWIFQRAISRRKFLSTDHT